MKSLGLWSVVLLVAMSAACNSMYDPPSLINKLRVLGVRAEPPVLTVTGPTTLEPLVVGYDADQPLCYAWSLCLFALSDGGNFRCIDAELETSLGTGSTASVNAGQVFEMLPKIGEVFDKLGLNPPEIEGQSPTDLAQDSTTEIYVRFKFAEAGTEGGTCPTDATAWLEKPCGDRSKCLAGYKRLELVTDPTKAHTNPVLEGIEVDGVAWPANVTPTVPCYQGDAEFGQLGKGAMSITPIWDAASKEEIGPNPDPTKPEPVMETMLFSWFSTGGDFDKQRSYDEVPENAFLPPDYGGKESQILTLWLVMRDGRNGTAWTQRNVEVRGDAPYEGNPLCRADPTLKGCP